MPPEERAVFLTFAHIMNEVNALLRASVWSANFSSPVQAIGDGQVSLTLMFIKLLAGKLNEAWQVINGAYFSKQLSREYHTRLSTRGRDALAEIKRYFSGQLNKVQVIRNSDAFHYSPAELASVLPSVSEPLTSYMQHESPQNDLFYFAEAVAAEALFQSIGMDNNNDTLYKLVDELFKLCASFANFFYDIMGTALEKLGQSAWLSGAEEVKFDSLMKFNDVHIPWFTERDAVGKKAGETPSVADGRSAPKAEPDR